jgi:uncharacterized RDD family membrane protein YckC
MTSLPDPDHQPEFYDGVPLKRFLAWIVDALLVLVACVVILPFTAFTGIFFFPLMILCVGFAYRVITLASGSATWGMRLFGMELRTARDARLDAGTAFAHTLGYTVSIGMMPLQLISIVLMCTTARCQGLSDMVLGTVALNRRAEN